MKTSIATNAVSLSLTKVLTLSIQMVIAMLLSRFRTLEEYGTYAQMLMVINLATSIFMLGLPNSINYFLGRANNERERAHFLSVYYTVSTILTFVIAIILLLSIDLIEAYFSNPLISNFLYFLVLVPWARIISSSIDHLLVFYSKTRFLLFYRVFNSVCLLLVVVLTEVMDQSFAFYLLLYTTVQGIFALSVYFISSKLVNGIRIKLDILLIKNVFKFSLPIGLASIVSTVSIELDKLFISWVMDVESVALYTNAARELPVSIISASLTAVLMPHVVVLLKEKKKEEAIKLWGSATLLAFIIIAFIVTAIYIYAEEVLVFLYSEKYLPGLSVFKVYTLVLLFRITYFGMILNATGKTKFILYSSIGSLILNITLNILLYHVLGFIGPAIATLASVATVNFYQLLYTCRIIGVRFRSLFPWREILRITAINILLGSVFFYIKSVQFTEQNSLLLAVLYGCIWAMLYFFLVRKSMSKEYRYLQQG